MGLFQKKIGPVFLKESSEASNFIEKMNELYGQVTDSVLKTDIQKQINLAKYGEIGEQNISFELKNSGMDMLILHDICLEYGDASAQIDYMVFTRKRTYVIECKNLIGNIDIDNQGNFIRSYELFGKKIKEGIYSPITQNQRHLEIIKNVRKESRNNFFTRATFEHYFEENYKSLVVLANPKTILTAKYAKKEVKDQVIRADQIIQVIKTMETKCDNAEQSEKQMYEVAEFFLSANKSERSDYAKKYKEMAEKLKEQKLQSEVKITEENSEQVKEMVIKGHLQQGNETTEKKCPRCGKNLVLRTAAKGNNAGNKFYGCSGFPKCRYIENI